MALTELQQKWIADVLGVDLRKFPGVPGGQGAPVAAPAPPRPDAKPGADAKSPAPADKVKEVDITIENASDASLLIVEEFLTRLSFDGVIPSTLAPGQKATLKFFMPEVTSDLLVYAAVPAGSTQAPKDAPSWQIKCLIEPGGKLVGESEVDAGFGLKAEMTSDGKGKILYKLSGKLKIAAATKAAAAARVGLTIDNQSDRTLRFIKADNDGGRFDPPPPQQIAPKKKFSFAGLDTGPKGGTLIYQLESKEGTAEEPDQLPWWNMSWKPMQAGQLPQTDSKLDPEWKGYSLSEAAGKNTIAFMLSGASAVTQTTAPPQAPPVGPAAGQRRIDVTFVNRSDRWLKYWGADKMTATFDRKPPDELKPGASASFAIFAKGSDEIHFGLMYSIVPTADAKAEAGTPKWTPHFNIPAGTAVMVPNSDIVPGIDGLKSSENPGTDAVSFVLSGKAAVSAEPSQVPHVPFRPQDVEQRIPITFTNNSNMVLRYWGADKMDVIFEQRPPDLIKPGQSIGFAVKGKRGRAIHFGLMYSILANETEKAKNGTPKWTPHFNVPPAENMIADCRIIPGMGGLKAGGWPDKDDALFVLSGRWAKDQELKTPVSIKNATPYKMRLVHSSAAPGRFNPAPPVEIAPGTTATCASWARIESDQKLVYELEAADGKADAAKGSPKPKPPRWTITWHTKPGDSPRVDRQVENVEIYGSASGLDGDDGVSFELDIKDDADTK
jgi:hypothetical protein